MRRTITLLALSLFATPSAHADSPYFEQSGATAIYDPQGARQLLANDGVTLQWISWDDRGTADISIDAEGTYTLKARQLSDDGQGILLMDGYIAEIGPGYFSFRGTITIEGAPDRERFCAANKLWHFAVTQNRRYWRLREFEWCDGLTDYIDIYM